MDFNCNRSWASPGRKALVLGAVLAGLLGLILAGSATAYAAAPTLEPVVSATPPSPNNTRTSTFTVGVDPAETETITQIQCRLDPTAATPWSYCLGAAGGGYSRVDLPNGLREIQFRTLNSDGAGPVQSVEWTMATPAPTSPPTIPVTPADPQTTVGASTFQQKVNADDATTVGLLECRVVSPSGVGEWTNCSPTSNNNVTVPNGTHTYQVRETNVAGKGPITEHTWTKSVPDVVSGALDVQDLYSARFDGPNQSARYGESNLAENPSNAGDVNGDGLNDLAISNTSGYLQIVFSRGDLRGSRTVNNLPAHQGYRIQTPSSALGGYSAIGDQNGDGAADLLLTEFLGGDYRVTVVYGIEDPSDLPICDNSGDRCLDLSSMTADEGFSLMVPPGDLSAPAASAGDLDGDGVDEFSAASSDAAYIVKGGVERSGSTAIDDLPADEFIKVSGPTGRQFGGMQNAIADLNGDGKDEIGILGGVFSGGNLYVFLGHEFTAAGNQVDIADFDESDGFIVATAPLGAPLARNAGDVNGDGRDDLMVGYMGILSSSLGQVSVVYMPSFPVVDPIFIGDDMESGKGYVFDSAGTDSALVGADQPILDFQGDGLPFVAIGAPQTLTNGLAKGGVAYLLRSHPSVDETLISLGPAFTPDLGIAIENRSSTTSGGFGTSISDMGDLDGDGITDFAIGAPTESNNGLVSSGSVYIIPGKSLMARSVTAGSTVVSDTKVTLNGQVGTNGRAVEYEFEYGKTADYGSSTASKSLGAGGSEPVSADLNGLAPDTTYHYRLVVTNEIGFARAGEDRTFTTAKTAPKQGCEADNTAPGCSGWDPCKADTTQPGCADYNYCKANPTKPECKAPEAKLSSLIVNAAASKVKRGKKTTATATIVNAGTASASGVKICLSAPKAMVSGARCISVGNLGAGATATRKFKVTVKKGAKKGKKVALSFKATANGLGAKAGKVSIKVG